MTDLNGRLYCITGDGTLWMRLPFLQEVDWTPIGQVPGQPAALAGHAGKLFLATADNALYWRDAVACGRSTRWDVDSRPPPTARHRHPVIYGRR